MDAAPSPDSSSDVDTATSPSTLSLVSRSVHRQQVELVSLRSQLAQLQARVEAQETVVAALERALDGLHERYEVLQRLTRKLEADIRSLERERQTIFILADRISHLETISRQETQGALEQHQIALEDINRCVISLEAVIVRPAD